MILTSHERQLVPSDADLQSSVPGLPTAQSANVKSGKVRNEVTVLLLELNNICQLLDGDIQ